VGKSVNKFSIPFWNPDLIRKNNALAALPGFPVKKNNPRASFTFLFQVIYAQFSQQNYPAHH
jgi:hypothetical protein